MTSSWVCLLHGRYINDKMTSKAEERGERMRIQDGDTSTEKLCPMSVSDGIENSRQELAANIREETPSLSV